MKIKITFLNPPFNWLYSNNTNVILLGMLFWYWVSFIFQSESYSGLDIIDKCKAENISLYIFHFNSSTIFPIDLMGMATQIQMAD